MGVHRIRKRLTDRLTAAADLFIIATLESTGQITLHVAIGHTIGGLCCFSRAGRLLLKPYDPKANANQVRESVRAAAVAVGRLRS
jgi:hypothetical protein